LTRSDVVESIRSYLQLIEKTEDGKIYINGLETEFNSLEEAKQYIKQDYITHQLEEQASKALYEELSHNTVANIIKEYHDVKVTDTLIENYIQLASSNMFSVDPVVQGIRSLNKLDRLIEGKLHYVLADESIVMIDESTQKILNNLLQNQTEIIEYMRESKENFFHVLKKIEEN
jgi:ABC-type transport system involved in cytochrome c biogenesis ATPase subunit